MIAESQFPPIQVPDIDLWAFLFERETPFPEDQAIFVNPETSRQYTYLDVKNTSIAFGHALETLWGWQKGDVLTTFAPNCIDTPALTWGTLWATGVISPANPAYSAAELAFQLQNSGAKAILTISALLKTAFEAAMIAGIAQERILVMGDERSLDGQHYTDFIREASYIPKVRRLACLIHHPIYAGIRTIVLPKFALDTWCQTVQDYKITYGYVVPPILLGLSKAPIVDNYDLTSLETFMSAAAPLTKEIVNAVWHRLKIPVKQAYGLSETSPATHIQRTEEWQTAVGSVGRLLPNQTAKFVSESGETLPVGSIGEFWVKGPNVFAGYLKNPSATANCMTSDGYFKTGDIGYQDEDGNFYITDRLKELIKYKGFQVAPAELEGLLVGSDLVADACVVGVYDESQAPELPLAFVVKAEKVKGVADEELGEEICKWIQSRVANHKWLRGGVRFIDEIPKSAAGKILRRNLRDKIKEEVASRSVKAKL